MKDTAEMQAIIDYVNGVRKCDPPARDIRDAAHEAVHALQAERRRGQALKTWNRNKVHEALVRSRSRAEVAMSEVLARVVEARICGHFGVEYKEPDGWFFLSMQEAHRDGTAFFDPKQLDAAVAFCEKSPATTSMVNDILSLGASNAV